MQTQQPLVNVQPALIPAETGKRIVAYLIDIVPCLLVGWIPILGLLAILGWIVARDLVFGGQSLGKKAMGLKVVNAETGGPADTQSLLIRNAVLLIPCFGLVELIVYFTSQDKRRLGDKWSKCTVVAA